MPSNTTYKPVRVDDFESSKLNYDAYGMSTTVSLGQSGHLDLTLSDDCLLTGAWFITNGGTFGDVVNFQVVDTSGAFTGTPGTVLNQFVTNWYVPPSVDAQFEIAYPAKVYAGLTLRLVYTSVGFGIVGVFVAVNYSLHKVLV